MKSLRLKAVIIEWILIAYFEEGLIKNVIVYTVIITKSEMLACFKLKSKEKRCNLRRHHNNVPYRKKKEIFGPLKMSEKIIYCPLNFRHRASSI